MSATYWRVAISASNGGTYSALEQVNFFNVVDDIITQVAATGGTASASSIYSSIYNADKAFDNNYNTAWLTVNGGVPSWIQYQFASAVDVNALSLKATSSAIIANPTQQAPKDFKLQSSNDGSNFTDVLTYTDISWTDAYQLRTFGFSFNARALGFLYRRNIEDDGEFKIIETVTELNSPVKRMVRLCDQRSGRLVRQSYSDAITGEVVFDHLRVGPWILYALDNTQTYQAVVISDRYATLSGERP
jgi:hypothetical protein